MPTVAMLEIDNKLPIESFSFFKFADRYLIESSLSFLLPLFKPSTKSRITRFVFYGKTEKLCVITKKMVYYVGYIA
ncbi:hypothetical protein BLOT_009084 [Blomia tropicalis]|nr:hypothetical protein BLOT_009084 [Blomia tropicalis]